MFTVVIFVSLSFLMTFNIVLVNQSRNVDKGGLYKPTTAVFLIGFIKLVLNFALLVACENLNFSRTASILKTEVVVKWPRTIRTWVPAVIYVIHDNLAYLALTYLDPGTFEVTLQVKVITTALLMKLLLGKVLHYMQWFSLFILLVGVMLVECNQFGIEFTLLSTPTTLTNLGPMSSHSFDLLRGFCATIAMTFTSAFAGVYFEKLLKDDNSASLDLSSPNSDTVTGISLLWVRNIQMFIFSVPVALFLCVVDDLGFFLEKGFFHGYDLRVWFIVVSGALGGLMTSVTLKYLDNIYKNFSGSLSIILASLCAIVFSNAHYNSTFVFGSTLVCFSLFLYYRSSAEHNSK